MSVGSILSTWAAIAGLVDAGKRVAEGLARGPNSKDREALRMFVRRLDERRVFYAPYNVEVVECCLGSLESMKDITEDTLAALEDSGARAAMGAILDANREFLDKWRGYTTEYPTYWHPKGPETSEREAAFFQDLGELRAVVLLMVRAILDLVKMDPPQNLFSDPGRQPH